MFHPIYTTDGGATWKNSNVSFSPALMDNWWVSDQVLTNDKVDNGVFYLFNKRLGEFYRSDDGGATFNKVYTDFENREADWCGTCGKYWKSEVTVRARPGVAGEVWMSLPLEGLFKSTDYGDTWTKIPGVQNAIAFSFGKGLTSDVPALYVMTEIGSERAHYTSDDLGVTWGRCDSDLVNFGQSDISRIEGDRQEYGVVYVGTEGRGILKATRGVNPPPSVTFPLEVIIDATPIKGDKPLLVSFDGSRTLDPSGGSIVSYAWDFGDGANGTGDTISHTFTEYGIYTTRLLVTSSSGDTASTTIDINVNGAPQIAWNSPADNTEFAVGETVTLKVDVTDGNGPDDIDRVIFWNANTSDWWNYWLHTDRDGPEYTFDVTATLGESKYLVQAFDKEGNNAVTEVLTIQGGNSAPDDYVIGINCGSNTVYQDTAGYIYQADPATTGDPYTTNLAIGNTADETLFQSERHGNPLNYALDVPNGTYEVVLKLAELAWEEAGQRVGDYAIEGQIVLDDFDVFAEAGVRNAVDTAFVVSVHDGTLNIDLTGVVRNPLVNGILVKTSDSVIAATSVAITTQPSDSVETTKTFQMEAAVTPAFASNNMIDWSVADTSVASISESGLLTGVAEGHTLVTATSQDGGFIDTCTVFIKEYVNHKPTVSWASPADSNVFEVGTSITLTTAVADGNGLADIKKVVFYDANYAEWWTHWLNTDNNEPEYTYSITVKAGVKMYGVRLM